MDTYCLDIPTKRIIAYGDKMEYTLYDDVDNYEMWYDTSPNRFTHASEKIYSQGVEYHIKIPCVDAVKKQCGLPYKNIPKFPVDIVNFEPLKIELPNKITLIDPCRAPFCRFRRMIDPHCKNCKKSDIGFLP